MIRPLTIRDYASWLFLAKEVEPLFGSMVENIDFQNGIKQCIESGDAFGIEHSDGSIAGIIAINRNENEIAWLAVGKNYRGNGYGNLLLKKAIDELDENECILVQTFSENCQEGIPARKLYLTNGFSDFQPGGLNPAGIDTVIMIRKKQELT
jgi:GNAT superfamily N-acetyltransferase